MKKLLLLLMLLPTLCFAQIPAGGKIAILYGTFGGTPITEDRFEATRRVIARGGWKVDYINVDSRTWQTGTDDATFFAARYTAVICLIDGFGTLVTASGFGTNFQNAAGTARVAYSPLGGRWPIPVYVITHRVVPSTTATDDSTTNVYMAGITSAAPAGTFAKPSATSWDAWRYKQIARLKSEKDSLFCDPVQFGCRPVSWGGPTSSSIAAIAYIDSGYAAGVFTTCAAGDTCVSAWKYVVRPNSPGVFYTLFSQSYNSGFCGGILIVLQRLASETITRPAQRIKIPMVEHDSRPAGATPYSATRMTNYKNLVDKLNYAGFYRVAFNPTAPIAVEIDRYTPEIINKFNEGVKSGTVKWVPQSYDNGFDANSYLVTDTTSFRQAHNELIRCAVSDTFGFDKSGYYKQMIVTAGGIVGTYLGKVYKDAGVEVIETIFNSENPAGWSFVTPPKPTYLSSYTIPGDGRQIFARLTLPLGHALTFVPGTHAATVGDNEYVGGTWIPSLHRAVTNVVGLYWHTGGVGGVCGDDPYFQWLLGDVFIRHVRYFDKVIEIDRFTNPRF